MKENPLRLQRGALTTQEIMRSFSSISVLWQRGFEVWTTDAIHICCVQSGSIVESIPE